MDDTNPKEKEIQKKIDEFGNLIDVQTAKLLIEYEKGELTIERTDKLKSKLDKLVNSHVEGLILEQEAERNYSKRDGSKGRFIGIRVALNDGREGRLMFWDNQIENVDFAWALPGQKVLISNCVYNDGKYGLTINTGKGGSVSLPDGAVIYPAIKK